RYLELRARALETDDYRPSDLAWLDMKRNTLDIVIGPIETYEDHLYGFKAAAVGYVLVKDQEWSQRLSRYAALLPLLQRGLPVPAQYKRERPGSDSDLNAYDAVFFAGQSNAGSKTIAINLPNDEQVQLQKGTRRLQLRNAMQAKFERILVPIAGELIAEDQRDRIVFDAFFANVMFHEVAHGLGIKNTITGRGTVRQALKEQAGALEEGKADILGLYLVTRLLDQGELTGTTLENHYVTYLAGLFRSIRFGASSAHGRANAGQFSFFEEHGAFTRDSATGRYRVDFPRMRAATDALAEQILRFQGDGDYAGVTTFMEARGRISPQLQSDLDHLATRGIPVDIVFDQGTDVLGLGR
ncbi:MAG: dipeptidyl-peptidase 3 family protein, partial [Gemmatimonadales bacterium]